MHNFFIIISGPTGVGKTDFVRQLGSKLPFAVEIINVDVGQFYTPLSIGTAKPAYKTETIPHHLFDIIDEPKDFTVSQFRSLLFKKMEELWVRGITPLLVGGSGFYIQSLFFPPADFELPSKSTMLPPSLAKMNNLELWQHLHSVDPTRALAVYPQDRYRVERALTLYYAGHTPSTMIPRFDMPAACAFYFLTRPREELYERINKRVEEMVHEGWIDEVYNLSTSWKEFLLTKKLIGYPEIIAFIEKRALLTDVECQYEVRSLIETIAQNTRAYAKRQMTYWRMMKKKIQQADLEQGVIKKVDEVDLTTPSLLEKISQELICIRECLAKEKK